MICSVSCQIPQRLQSLEVQAINLCQMNYGLEIIFYQPFLINTGKNLPAIGIDVILGYSPHVLKIHFFFFILNYKGVQIT